MVLYIKWDGGTCEVWLLLLLLLLSRAREEGETQGLRLITDIFGLACLRR